MGFNCVWRLVPKISRFLVFDSRGLVAEVPRNREGAESNAKAISLLPQIYWAARALSDGADSDFVVSADLAHANALLAGLGGFGPSAWRARRCSVLRYGPRPLVARVCDESLAAAIAALPELVGSLRFVGGSAEGEPIQRVAPCGLWALRGTCWEPRLEVVWRASRRPAPRAAVQAGGRRPPQRVGEAGADDWAKFVAGGAA